MLNNHKNEQLAPSLNAAMTRRDLIKRAAVVGIGVPVTASLLAACEADDDEPADGTDDEAAAVPTDDTDEVTDDPVEEDVDDEPADEDFSDDIGEGEPKRGGHVVGSNQAAYTSLDVQIDNVTGQGATLLYNGLVRYVPEDDQDDETQWFWEQELAESWEFDDDGGAVTFELREDVLFHDGSPFDAETAEWNYMRLRDHDLSRHRTRLEPIIQDMSVEDEYTFRVEFYETSAEPVLFQFVHPLVSMVAVEELGDDDYGQEPVGTGPFRFVDWAVDDFLDLERNPDYWEIGDDGEPLPYFDTFRELLAVDLARSADEIRAGTVDVYSAPQPDDINTLREAEGVEFNTIPGTFRHDLARVMINADSEPFSDVRVRHAAIHALDEQGFANAMGRDVLEPHYTLWWAPGVLGYDEDIRSPEYDPERAQELLAEVGYEDGIDIEVFVQNRTGDRRAGEVMQQMLEAVGFRVTIETAERVTYNQRLADRDYHISTIGTGTSPDPEQQSGNFTTGGPGNWGAYSNPEVDELVDQARQSSDEEERAELYKEVQRLIHEDGEITILSRHPGGNMTRSRLKGVLRDNVVANLRYAWLEEDE